MTRRFAVIAAILLTVVAASAARAADNPLDLRKGDRICLVGNALGERMQHHNHFETLLHAHVPDLELSIRNLCFPADEVTTRLRSENFGTPDDHLTHSKADVILYFFGLNESYAGPGGVAKFAKELTDLVEHNKRQKYNGQSPPRIALVSPIAFDGGAFPGKTRYAFDRNANLRIYIDAMRDVAAKTGVGFVDVFTPTHKLFTNADHALTTNGIHLNDDGYRLFAPILLRALLPELPMAKLDAQQLAKIRELVADKSFHWWHRYRAVNGYSIYGPRGKAGKGPDGHHNTAVMERELAILDAMTANRDRRVWAVAQGKPLSALPKEVLDDSNTPQFIKVESNVAKGNPGKQKGKLGELEYQSPDESIKQFTLAEGYEIELYASEVEFPDLINPVSIRFDNKGRLWVATMPSYPQWKPKTKLDDKVLILEDSNGDGKADKQTIFARGLHQPTGFEIGRGGAFIAEQPDVIHARDTDGDGRADEYKRPLFGFCSADSHHGLAAFTWGPGGGLYFQEGTFKYSQVETPRGPVRLEEAGVWRHDPRSWETDVYVSMRFSNPWGHVFDRWGQSFIADASPGQHWWATPVSGRVIYPDKHPGGQQGRRFNEKTKPPYLLSKRVRPTAGNTLVSSANFPPEAQGNYLVCNVIGFRGVLQHAMKEVGSGFAATEIEPLVVSDEGNFRPVDITFGPDGALYICDWHNALIGHLQHNLRDPNRDHKHGRVWRVRYKGRPLAEPVHAAGRPIPELLDLLKHDIDRVRYDARRELAERDSDAVIKAVGEWIAKLDVSDEDHQHHLLEALWVHQTHHRVDEKLLEGLLRSPEPRARAAATRVLSYWRDDVRDALSLLKELVADKHPRVRLEAVRALSFFDKPEAAEIALEVLNHEIDEYLQYTLDETMRTLDKVTK